nr:PREDICTED: protein Njmu-R1-like [Bos mutus]
MLPSLQESLDGDEKELESSEEGGSAEERRLDPPPSSHYCLYSYRGSRLAQQRADSDDGSPGGTNAETPSGDDFSLSLVDTNLPSEVEPELRSFIAKRLSKGAVFEGLGNVAAVELRIPGYRVGCYYCLFQQEKLLPQTASTDSEQKSSEYVVCFLGGSEKGLELFRLELDKYIQGLKNNMNCEESGGENHIQSYLSSWFADVVCPIQRVVHLFQEKLTFLLHALSLDSPSSPGSKARFPTISEQLNTALESSGAVSSKHGLALLGSENSSEGKTVSGGQKGKRESKSLKAWDKEGEETPKLSQTAAGWRRAVTADLGGPGRRGHPRGGGHPVSRRNKRAEGSLRDRASSTRAPRNSRGDSTPNVQGPRAQKAPGHVRSRRPSAPKR